MPLVQQAAHLFTPAFHILQQDNLAELHYSVIVMRVGLLCYIGNRFQ